MPESIKEASTELELLEVLHLMHCNVDRGFSLQCSWRTKGSKHLAPSPWREDTAKFVAVESEVPLLSWASVCAAEGDDVVAPFPSSVVEYADILLVLPTSMPSAKRHRTEEPSSQRLNADLIEQTTGQRPAVSLPIVGNLRVPSMISRLAPLYPHFWINKLKGGRHALPLVFSEWKSAVADLVDRNAALVSLVSKEDLECVKTSFGHFLAVCAELLGAGVELNEHLYRLGHSITENILRIIAYHKAYDKGLKALQAKLETIESKGVIDYSSCWSHIIDLKPDPPKNPNSSTTTQKPGHYFRKN